jgi:hypothetical protein
VLKAGARGIWSPVRVAEYYPRNLTRDEVALRGKLHDYRMTYGIEQYYLPEYRRQAVEKLTRNPKNRVLVRVKVDARGRSAIEELRYTAVPISEFSANLRRELQICLEFLEINLPARETVVEPFITITGRNQILHKMKNLIGQAEARIYLSIASNEAQLLLSELRAAVERGLKVVIITDQALKFDCATLYYRIKKPGQIRLITDSNHVLTGELSEKPDTACLYSKNQNLVQLIKDSLTNEIELIELSKQA